MSRGYQSSSGHPAVGVARTTGSGHAFLDVIDPEDARRHRLSHLKRPSHLARLTDIGTEDLREVKTDQRIAPMDAMARRGLAATWTPNIISPFGVRYRIRARRRAPRRWSSHALRFAAHRCHPSKRSVRSNPRDRLRSAGARASDR